MYNEELFKKLSEEFSEEEMLIFCKINARQLYLIGQNFKLLKVKEDYSFDAEWWNMKYLQLLDNQLKLQEEEYER